MKLEDKASTELMLSGALGKRCFFRYSITVNRQHQEQETALLSEALDWLKEAGVGELSSVSASYGKGKKVLLVTMAFPNNVLANLFINMESTRPGFIKKMEIAGTESLYVFDSERETAFTSDCVKPTAYDFANVNPLNHDWLAAINSSLVTGEMAVIK